MKGHVINATRAGQARAATIGDDGKPLSQRAAADLLGVHPVTLNRIEGGKYRVSTDLLERMTQLYGQSRDWLLGVEGEDLDALNKALARRQLTAALEVLADVLFDVAVERGAARPTKSKAAA